VSAAEAVRWGCAAAMMAVAAYHGGRLPAARLLERRVEADVDLSHSAMGVAMTLMLVSSPGPASARAWSAVLAVPTLWFAGRAGYRHVVLGRPVGPELRQVVLGAAMLYMILAAGPLPRVGAPAMQMTGMQMTAGSGPALLMAGPTSLTLDVVLLAATAAVLAWTALGLLRGFRGDSGHGQLRTAGARVHLTGLRSAPLAPALTASCQLAMSATTAYMLVQLL
jgi:hypothetical protein